MCETQGQQGQPEGAKAGPLALYVHIPFCETRCPYCDFNTYSRLEALIPAYIPALRAELTLWGEALGHPLARTVFFGGGTPSYLPSPDIASVLETIRLAFQVDEGAEVTLEANPGDFTLRKLEDYLAQGVNRLSIGVQSFDDRLLRVLGRRHSASQAIEAYHMALEAGFHNVSIDLMFGLPHQGLEDWQATLATAGELAPRHISMYCLTLEEGTPMERWVRTGALPEPDPDLAADMYLLAQEVMEGLGYRHYEISNWARPGYESRHNLTYWRNQPYLGVGPGAHSYLAGHRFANLKSPREYIRRLQRSAGAAQVGRPLDAEAIRAMPAVEALEAVGMRLEMAETMMLGLRLDTGIDPGEFQRRFGQLPSQAYPDAIAELTTLGLLETRGGALRLTRQGRMVGNQVFSRFFQ